MSRATRPEAVRAGKKVLLIDGLQYHDDRPLRHLVLEGWKAEWPKRSGSIALGDVDPPDRWRLVAARLDALQEVRKIGLQALRILGRCHTIDTGSTILAGKPVGLPHPFQVEDVVQCGQSHPAFGSCKISYPLPFRGQVCKAQGPLPCCPSAVLSSRRPPSLDWVPASPVPQRHKHYEGATTPTRRITGHLFGSLPVPTRFLQSSCSLCSAPGRVEVPHRARIIGQPAIQIAGVLSRGREWDISGFQATRPVPLPRSRIPAESAAPRHRRCRRCRPRNTGHEGFSGLSYRDHHGASASAAYASRTMLPPSLQGSLPAGWLAFTGRESIPLDHDERFPSCYISSPFPGFNLTLRHPKPVTRANIGFIKAAGFSQALVGALSFATTSPGNGNSIHDHATPVPAVVCFARPHWFRDDSIWRDYGAAAPPASHALQSEAQALARRPPPQHCSHFGLACLQTVDGRRSYPFNRKPNERAGR